MARDQVVSSDRGDWPFVDPAPFWKCGLAACGAAFLLYPLPVWIFQATGLNFGAFALEGGAGLAFRLLLLAVGILAAAGAVVTRPKCPAVLGLAAVASWLAGQAMDPDWDSARFMMNLLAFVALFAAFLLLLPLIVGKIFSTWEFMFSGHRDPDTTAAEKRGRFAGWALSRAIVVILVVFHFFAIVSAVMSVPPPGRDQSWLFNQSYTFFQPYLQFMHLRNAYRFYSPEPGPPTLLWFHIAYEDGSTRWVKLPGDAERAKDPLGQEFTRRLSLGENVNQNMPSPAVPPLVTQRRMVVAREIPTHPFMGSDPQYRPPTDHARTLAKEFSRFVAHHYPSERDPESPVKRVKLYRVIHGMLNPVEMAERTLKPTDPWTYYPTFLGTFSPDGELKDPDDPLLYWVIPIYRAPKNTTVNPLAGQMPIPPGTEYDLYDYLEIHANMDLNPEGKQP